MTHRSRHVLSALLVGLGGCGYSMGYDDQGPAGRTVAVEIVDNRSFRQRIEIELTRAILLRLPSYGGLRPATHEDADTVLEVTLVDVQGRSLVGSGGGFPVREGALDFAVELSLIDRTSGAVLREARVLDRAEFRPAIGETEASARSEGVTDLARKIVLALEADF